MDKVNSYEIQERLSIDELTALLTSITAEHGQCYYRHKNSDIYFAGSGTIINMDNKSYQAIQYYPVNIFTEEILYTIPHTRPLHEFLDGRFTRLTIPTAGDAERRDTN